MSFAIKAVGPALLGNSALSARAAGVIAVLAPALLASLVASDLLGSHWSAGNGALALGVVTAVGTRSTGAPAPVSVIAAIVVTAGAHAVQ